MLALAALIHLAGCRIIPPGTATDSGPDSGGDTATTLTDAVTVDGLIGPSGGLLWTDDPENWIVEVSEDGASWEPILSGSSPWVLPRQPEGAWFRLTSPVDSSSTAAIQPPPVTVDLRLGSAIVGTGDRIAGQLRVSLDGSPISSGAVEGLSLQLSRQSVRVAPEWLDGDCLKDSGKADDCWTREPATLSVWEMPLLVADDPVPTSWSYQASITAERGEALAVLHGRQASIVETGRQLAFGDLHAHSNLSHDGCETLDEICSSRGKEAAEGFFQVARDGLLDFAAITDHAEFVTLEPVDGGDPADIWTAQQDAVLEADGLGMLPLIGYEWTSATGHRTVLFEEAAPCALQRIPAWLQPTDRERVDGGDYLIANTAKPRTEPQQLWDALAAGGAACKSTERVLTIPHHPAASTPNPVVWAEEYNTPDLYYERLVEIASEHGTSECVDTSADHCDYRLKVGIYYEAGGSVQAALQEGYRLGFVGGTDSHDSSPGSLDDGPSCIASILEDGSHRCHDYPGALTGVYYAGVLDRRRLFDGLYDRNTLATTGPRPDLHVALVSPEGRAYLPGDDVPATKEASYRLVLSLPGVSDDEILGIELLRPDGGTEASWDTARVEDTLTASPGDIRYLRVRLDVDGIEERIWLSPFFIGE